MSADRCSHRLWRFAATLVTVVDGFLANDQPITSSQFPVTTRSLYLSIYGMGTLLQKQTKETKGKQETDSLRFLRLLLFPFLSCASPRRRGLQAAGPAELLRHHLHRARLGVVAVLH